MKESRALLRELDRVSGDGCYHSIRFYESGDGEVMNYKYELVFGFKSKKQAIKKLKKEIKKYR